MRLSRIRAGMFALALGVLLARPGFAQSQGEITNVTTNGISTPPGPIVQNLAISTLQNRNDEVQFDAYMFTTGPLDFTVTVSGPGAYYIGYGRMYNVTDYAGPGTGVGFAALEATLENAPSGSGIGALSYDNHFATVSFDSPTEATFNGPPGIPVEESASFYVGVGITGSGTQTFDLVLTPVPVPEPSTLVLGLIGAIAGLGYAARRRWRRG